MSAQPSPLSRLFRFTGALDLVIGFDGGDRLVAINPMLSRFRVVGPGRHPNGGEPCLIGEFFGGPNDGMLFYFEPGADHPDIWPQIASDEPS